MYGPQIRLDSWSEGDLALLRRVNAPEMTTHIGGPETEEQVLARHRRYLSGGTGQMFRVTLLPEEIPVGTIGYWERQWRDDVVYETGWSVLPEHQGLGIAAAAAVAVAGRAAGTRAHDELHAFPSVDHPASNGVCRRAGFTLVGEVDFEYPPGRPIRCNDWRLALSPSSGQAPR
jgi:RimJ/RimL family protein N-acetyltransferase